MTLNVRLRRNTSSISQLLVVPLQVLEDDAADERVGEVDPPTAPVRDGAVVARRECRRD